MSVLEPTTVTRTVDTTPNCWSDYPQWPNTSSQYYWVYPSYWEGDRIKELEAKVSELEEKLKLLEEKTGYEVVENPRFKVRKIKEG